MWHCKQYQQPVMPGTRRTTACGGLRKPSHMVLWSRRGRSDTDEAETRGADAS